MEELTERIDAVIKAWETDPKGLAPDIVGTLARALAPTGTDPESLRPPILTGIERAFRSHLPGKDPVTVAEAVAWEVRLWLEGFVC